MEFPAALLRSRGQRWLAKGGARRVGMSLGEKTLILFIDHRDSFSWNLIAQLRGLGFEVEVRQSEELVVPFAEDELRGREAVVFSPGPGHPRDYPNSLALYHAAKGRLPIIGVCLGFQLMLEAEGIQVEQLPEILHGVQTPIRIDPEAAAYRGVSGRPRVGRYHSLGLPKVQLPEGWQASGWDAESGRLLSFENRRLRLFGFQYHPDSFLTPEGNRILGNTLRDGLANEGAPGVVLGNLWERAGVFTTLRVSIRQEASGKVATLWFPNAHGRRMQRDLTALELDQEDPWRRQSQFIDATRSIATSLAPGEWLVRWSCAPPEKAIEARRWSPGDPTLTAKCWQYVRRHPAHKHLSYSDLLAKLREVDRQSTEVLLVHPEKGLLLEGITCNLLCVEQGRWVTPAEDCLPGLSLGLLETNLPAGRTISRAPIPIDQINRFDAIYACGTGRGVIPIVRIPELGWEQRDDSLTDLLQEAYRSLIRSTDDRIELPLD